MHAHARACCVCACIVLYMRICIALSASAALVCICARNLFKNSTGFSLFRPTPTQILLVFEKNLVRFDVIHFRLRILNLHLTSVRHAERASMQSAPRLGRFDAEVSRRCGEQKIASFCALLAEHYCLETKRGNVSQFTRFVVVFWAARKCAMHTLTDFCAIRFATIKYANGE